MSLINYLSLKYKFEYVADTIVQFRYFNIQPKTIDITTRLQGIDPTNSIVYSPEPRNEVICFKPNFNISKLGNCTNI